MKESGSSVPASPMEAQQGDLALGDGDRVAVVGGGPAGCFFAYFVRRIAASVNLRLTVDLYEPRPFTLSGPAGCNHCGGIVSESLVQLLASEGIVLPEEVVQRGIDAYVLHMDVGNVSIAAASQQKRIAAVYRGNGPRDSEMLGLHGFDHFLLGLASGTGTNIVRRTVGGIEWHEGRPEIVTIDRDRHRYDLVAVAVGVNSSVLAALGETSPRYVAPRTRKAFICEFRLGREAIEACLGSSMHVFLLDIPRLEFAALIPKGEFATLCMIGHDIDDDLVARFLATPEVRACFSGGEVPPLACICFPRINVHAAAQPFSDRIVWLGDTGACKLYKDGIGSAYKTSKAAAATAVLQGVARSDFAGRFRRECAMLEHDNRIAGLIFALTKLIQRARFLRQGVLRMIAREQGRPVHRRHMSNMLWDVFTGSAPYRDILLRSFHPEFPAQLAWNLLAGNCAAVARALRGRRHAA